MSTMLFGDLIISNIITSSKWSSLFPRNLHFSMSSPWIWPLSAGSPWRTLHPRAVVQRCCPMWSKGMCCWKCHWKLGMVVSDMFRDGGDGSSYLWNWLNFYKMPYWGSKHQDTPAVFEGVSKIFGWVLDGWDSWIVFDRRFLNVFPTCQVRSWECDSFSFSSSS